MLPGKYAEYELRFLKAGGMTRALSLTSTARRQTPEEMAQRMMRIEERGTRTQLM